MNHKYNCNWISQQSIDQ